MWSTSTQFAKKQFGIGVSLSCTPIKAEYVLKPYGLDILQGVFGVSGNLSADVQTDVTPNFSVKTWVGFDGQVKSDFYTAEKTVLSINIAKALETKYDKNFSSTCDAKPVVTTNPITSITSSRAVSGGEITDDAGLPITGRGVCWNTTGNPQANTNEKTFDGAGLGKFTSDLQSLRPNTTYYVRAYAYNDKDTGYGNEVTFTTQKDEIKLIKVSGPSQGIMNQYLSEPLRIRVTDGENGVQGAKVTFNVISGGGIVDENTVETDADGYAETKWKAGNIEGEQSVEVSATNNEGITITGTPLIFTAQISKSVVKLMNPSVEFRNNIYEYYVDVVLPLELSQSPDFNNVKSSLQIWHITSFSDGKPDNNFYAGSWLGSNYWNQNIAPHVQVFSHPKSSITTYNYKSHKIRIGNNSLGWAEFVWRVPEDLPQ